MQEIKTVLSVDVGNAPKTVKELKDHIKNLQDALVRTDETSEDYKSTLNQLISSQSKLQSIMKASKSDVAAAEGSYNALNATMKELQKQWKATGDEVERNRLGAAILDINNQLKEFDSSIGNNQRKVGAYTEGVVDAFAQLRGDIKKYKSELLSLEEGTEEYNQTLAKLGEAQFQMKDMTEQAKYAVADIGETLNAVNKVAQGVVGGFNAIKGIMALTGTESEALEETFVKLQAGMAIVQGLQGMEGMIDSIKGLNIVFGKGIGTIKTFIKSLNGIKSAVAGTGIGLLVVAIGTLIANWEKVIKLFENTDPVKKTREEIDKLNETFDINTKLAEKGNDEVYLKYIKNLEQAGNNAEQLAQIMSAYNQELKDNERQLLINNKLEAEKLQYKAYIDFATIQAAGYKEDSKRYKEAQQNYLDATAAANKAQMALATFDGKQIEENAKKTIETNKKLAEDNKKKKDEAKKLAEEEKKQAKQYADDAALALMEAEDREKEILRREYEEKKTLLEKHNIDTKNLTDEYNKNKTEIEKKYSDERVAKVREELEEKLSLQTMFADMAAAKSEASAYNKSLQSQNTTATSIWGDMRNSINGNPQEDAKLQSEIEYNNTLLQIEQERFDKQKAIWEEEMNHSTTSAERKLELEQQIAIATIEFDNRTTETQIRNAELVKKAQQDKINKIEQSITGSLGVMSDVFDTISELSEEGSKEAKGFAIAAAVMDTLSSAVGAYKSTVSIPYVGPILAPIAAATALAAGYAQVKKIQSTDEKTGNGGMGSSVGVTASIPSDLTSVSYTRNLMGDAETEEMNKAQQVYILESDIEEAGRKVEVREQNTNF